MVGGGALRLHERAERARSTAVVAAYQIRLPERRMVSSPPLINERWSCDTFKHGAGDDDARDLRSKRGLVRASCGIVRHYQPAIEEVSRVVHMLARRRASAWPNRGDPISNCPRSRSYARTIRKVGDFLFRGPQSSHRRHDWDRTGRGMARCAFQWRSQTWTDCAGAPR